MKYEIIDNFLSEDEHIFLIEKFVGIGFNTGSVNWFLNNLITNSTLVEENHNLYYFTHLFYQEQKIYSDLYENLIGNIFLKKLDVKSLIRAKGNLYPRAHKLTEHGYHKDFPFEHKGAIYYINSNDGYTILEDGTKIESVANRLLKFDASKPHTSTDCTNDKYRVNINFNYF